MERDYKKDYEEFWKTIVENDDGTLNKDQVMKELSDFRMVIDHCERIYDIVTDGMISKCTTLPSNVENIFRANYMARDTLVSDIYDMLEDIDSLEELKEELVEYFDLASNESEE